MKNSGAMKMYLAMAVLLAIAEILLLATGNGKLPIAGLVLFECFYALALSVQKYGKTKRIILYTPNFCIRLLYTLFPANVHKLGI